MKVQEAIELIREANIAEEGDKAFTAAVMIFIGHDYDWDLDEIHKATNFDYSDIAEILKNFYENEIIVDGKLNIEVCKDELSNILEVTLIAMCGAGEIVRSQEKDNNEIENKINSMATKKTLNDHLFEQLERLSEANGETIDLEMNKAASMIQVSEQILSVARLKLEIMQSGAVVGDDFKELDAAKENNLIDNKTKETSDDVVDEQSEVVPYGNHLISKKTLGNHKIVSPDQF